jgi:hypothetical protein
MLRYGELSDTAKERAIEVVFNSEQPDIEWSWINEDLLEVIREIAKEAGLHIDACEWDYNGYRAKFTNIDGNLVDGKRETLLSDQEIAINSHFDKFGHFIDVGEYWFDPDICDHYYREIEAYRELDFESVLAFFKDFDQELYGQYRLNLLFPDDVDAEFENEVSEAFFKLCNQLCKIMNKKINDFIDTTLRGLSDLIEKTYSYYEGYDHIRNELATEGSYAEENHRFNENGEIAEEEEEEEEEEEMELFA